MEIGRVRPAEALWRRYFESGRWRGDSLIARMTGSGRAPIPTSGSLVACRFGARILGPS